MSRILTHLYPGDDVRRAMGRTGLRIRWDDVRGRWLAGTTPYFACCFDEPGKFECPVLGVIHELDPILRSEWDPERRGWVVWKYGEREGVVLHAEGETDHHFSGEGTT